MISQPPSVPTVLKSVTASDLGQLSVFWICVRQTLRHIHSMEYVCLQRRRGDSIFKVFPQRGLFKHNILKNRSSCLVDSSFCSRDHFFIICSAVNNPQYASVRQVLALSMASFSKVSIVTCSCSWASPLPALMGKIKGSLIYCFYRAFLV